METVFKIIGGGQRIQQNVSMGSKTEFVRIENSDLVEKSKCHGVDSYTNVMWSTDLADLQRWANEWAGEEVELVEKL